MATAAPSMVSNGCSGGIHRESSTGFSAGSGDAWRKEKRVNRSATASTVASAQGANRCHAGSAGTDESGLAPDTSSLSAASEIALRRPEDACAGVPVDEFDNLSGASSEVKVFALMGPVAVARVM